MSVLTLQSGQSNTCSDRYVAEIICGPSTPARVAAQSTAALTCGSARFPHRTLQPLRQARLPLCRGQGPGSEVLPVGEFSGRTLADGLRAAGVRAAGSRVRGKPATD